MPPGGSAGGPVAPAALIDTHVHFHDCFDAATFLDAADVNFDRAGGDLDLDRSGTEAPARVLLVMETGRGNLIHRLEGTGGAGDWHAEPTTEAGALTLVHEDRESLVVVEGRQVVTTERLEVLAAPCADDLPSGLPLPDTLTAAERHGAVPILPWGFGKWTGRRGRIVARLLDSWSPDRLLLADNGGRLAFGWKPRLLTLGAQRGFPIVRGSDPLPRASEVSRVGSSGSLLRGSFDARRPVSGVRALLGACHQSPRSFGAGVGPIDFLTNQVHMQLRRSGR